MTDRQLAGAVYAVSAAVCLLVLVLVLAPQLVVVEGLDVSPLPRAHAVINGATALLLLLGYSFIRRGQIGRHRVAMVAAFGLSCIFLLSYLVYHAQAPDARFGGEGIVRVFYFAVLVSHIVLASLVLPLALYTVARALREEFPRHRRVARWTLPVWLYVAVTGVIVYLMMAPYYPS